MEQRDQLLDLIIRAQRSSMKSAVKKSWVIAQLDGGPEMGEWIDWVVMILKDPAVHSLALLFNFLFLEFFDFVQGLDGFVL